MPDRAKSEANHDKKTEERWVVEALQAVVPWFPRIVPTQFESPDFVLGTGANRIALELTRYHQSIGPGGSTSRASEEARDRVMALAQREFERRNPGRYLYVYPHWRSGPRIAKSDSGDLAVRLVQLVENLSPRLDESRLSTLPTAEASYPELQLSGLEPFITSLTIYRYPTATYGLWAAPEVGYVSGDVAELERIVRTKERLLDRYRTQFAQSWLVIYAMNRPSGAFDVEAAQNFRLKSQFDTVIFFDAVSRQYATLKGPDFIVD